MVLKEGEVFSIPYSIPVLKNEFQKISYEGFNHEFVERFLLIHIPEEAEGLWTLNCQDVPMGYEQAGDKKIYSS